MKEDLDKSGTLGTLISDNTSPVFSPISESVEGDDIRDAALAKNDDNNNNGLENLNKNLVNGATSLSAARRKESRKTSHFDIDTIMEEIDELAVKRDSSPNTSKPSKPLPKTPTEFMQRKKYKIL